MSDVKAVAANRDIPFYNPELSFEERARDIVSRLSHMGDNKVATDYMLELLNSK